MNLKTCSRCKIEKPTSEFYRGIGKDGLYCWCKPCATEYRRAKSKTEESKAWWKEYRKKWNESNPEKIKGYSEKFRKSERWKEYIYKYNRDNRSRYRLRQANRRARFRAAGGIITNDEWNYLVFLFDGRCAYCGEKKKLTIDHVVPVISGGVNTAYNIVPACEACNKSKGTKSLLQFVLYKYGGKNRPHKYL